MSKSFIVFAIVALLCGPLAAEPPVPLTAAEALRYVTLLPEQASEDIMRLEAIESAAPVLMGPELVVLATADSVRAFWQPAPVLIIDIGGVLQYAIELPEARAPLSRPPPSLRGYAITAFVALAAGAFGGLLLGVGR